MNHVEYRVLGPPGTGKTTYLSRQVASAVEVHGNTAVMVASYTKTAADEIAGRHLPIERSQVGTLHAMGYRSLGKPRVVDAELLTVWNEQYPDYEMSGGLVTDPDDPVSDSESGGTSGDVLLSRYDMARAQMLPEGEWLPGTVEFAGAWELFKEKHDAVDFTDMIAIPYRDCPVAPGNPTVGIFDECQDMSRLEWALVRRWATAMDHVVVAGDDDQCLYEWRGASVDAFIGPEIDSDHTRVLHQSYRVPKLVHEVAVKWIEQAHRRAPKEYLARNSEGCVVSTGASFKQAEDLVQQLYDYSQEGKSVAVLASCSYFLNSIMAVLRQEGIPFHNPWRRRRGDWNPLYAGRGVSLRARFLAWLGPYLRADGTSWTIEEAKLWVPLVKTEGVLKRGAKTAIARAEGMTFEQWRDWFELEAATAADAGDVGWLISHAVPAKLRGLDYLGRITRRGLIEADPKVIVSTIHASKGREADVVFVLPDLSRAGYETWYEDEDQIRRLFYVAMTRARETLVLCEPGSRMAVDL